MHRRALLSCACIGRGNASEFKSRDGDGKGAREKGSKGNDHARDKRDGKIDAHSFGERDGVDGGGVGGSYLEWKRRTLARPLCPCLTLCTLMGVISGLSPNEGIHEMFEYALEIAKYIRG